MSATMFRNIHDGATATLAEVQAMSRAEDARHYTAAEVAGESDAERFAAYCEVYGWTPVLAEEPVASACVVGGGVHSKDVTLVHTGYARPLPVCGYHASRGMVTPEHSFRADAEGRVAL